MISFTISTIGFSNVITDFFGIKTVKKMKDCEKSLFLTSNFKYYEVLNYRFILKKVIHILWIGFLIKQISFISNIILIF